MDYQLFCHITIKGLVAWWKCEFSHNLEIVGSSPVGDKIVNKYMIRCNICFSEKIK